MNNILMDNIITNDVNISLNVNENKIINIYAQDDNGGNINIIQNNNSHLIINYVSITKKDIETNISIKIMGSNNKCNINYHVLGIGGLNKSKVCVKTFKDTFNNDIVENLKGLCDKGNILIEPILETDTNNVSASHFVTIGSYNENDLIYLNSMGISENESKKILKNSFRLNIFNDEMKKLIREKEV